MYVCRSFPYGKLLLSLCVCRYEYLRREGNFERSSGLQMGVDTITVSTYETTLYVYKITVKVCGCHIPVSSSGQSQYRFPVWSAYSLPTEHPGEHQEALRGGQTCLRPHRHEAGLWELTAGARWYLYSCVQFLIGVLSIEMHSQNKNNGLSQSKQIGDRNWCKWEFIRCFLYNCYCVLNFKRQTLNFKKFNFIISSYIFYNFGYNYLCLQRQSAFCV